jgi:hypothetical protein
MRGECQCGRCIDKGDAPDPEGHTVSTGFFQVAAMNDPSKEEFEQLVRAHPGDFTKLDMFAAPHHFIEVGAFMGDQGLGMQMMALGHLLGSWRLLAKDGEGCLTLPLPNEVAKSQ